MLNICRKSWHEYYMKGRTKLGKLTTYRRVWSNSKRKSHQAGHADRSLKWSVLNETRVQWKPHCLSTLLACAKTLQPCRDSWWQMSSLYAHFTGNLSAFSKLSPTGSPNDFPMSSNRARPLKWGWGSAGEWAGLGASLLRIGEKYPYREKAAAWGTGSRT